MVAGRISEANFNLMLDKTQKEQAELKERVEVLDKRVMRLYEDMIAGRISYQNFNTMLENTQTEHTELETKLSEGWNLLSEEVRKKLADEIRLAYDARQWV